VRCTAAFLKRQFCRVSAPATVAAVLVNFVNSDTTNNDRWSRLNIYVLLSVSLSSSPSPSMFNVRQCCLRAVSSRTVPLLVVILRKHEAEYSLHRTDTRVLSNCLLICIILAGSCQTTMAATPNH